MKEKKYIVDFTEVNYYWEVHAVLKESLDFPDYYGCNWDAFWDCLMDMYYPIHIEIIGLENIRKRFDDSADKMIEILKRFKHHGDDSFSDKIRIEIVDGDKREVLS